MSDLIARMTLEEKARQLDMYAGCKSLLDAKDLLGPTHAQADAPFDPARAEKVFGNLGAGSVHDLYPQAAFYNKLQAWIIHSNRLGIPALFIEEGLHGFMAYGQTVFPQSINLATTWNPDLARATGAAIAAEARAHGVGMILGPVLDVARDPRWGRTEETFGEDAYLNGRMGLAYVTGMQGESLDTDHTCIAEPKHFAGHGAPEGGLNTSPVHLGEREMRMVMLKSFEPAIREGGAMGVMAAYHDIDGVPCTANPWLMNTVLRGEWGFQGMVLSDLAAIRRLQDPHHVASSPLDAVSLALNSGVDMQFYDYDNAVFQGCVVDGVKQGRISVATLDAAVSRILRLKFLLGLFDHPFVDEHRDAVVRRSPEHQALSLGVARESMCLLQNRNNLLPLSKDLAAVALIGPNANTSRLGDYSEAAEENARDGLLEQVRKLVSPRTAVLYADGQDIDLAIATARKADVVIAALGEKQGISGEGFDRSDLGLPGDQQALLEALVRTGKPVVLVLLNGRPLVIPWAAEHVSSILEAWYPGEFGGRAIAETLWGDNNPAGRLTVSFPRSAGRLPVYYDHFPSRKRGYVDGDDASLFPFGHGLSYTSFTYDHLSIEPPAPGSGADAMVTFDVANTGARGGDEVTQLYVRPTTASVATPVKTLKAFARIHLDAGATKSVTLRVKQTDLAIWGGDRTWKIEPGEYKVWVGGSSVGGLSATFRYEPGFSSASPRQ